MNNYNENRYRRKKTFYRMKLGIEQFKTNYVLNILWVGVILAIYYFISIKDWYIISINIPTMMERTVKIIDYSISFLIPIVIILSLFYFVGELVARKIEADLLLVFEKAELKKGVPLLTSKKYLNNNKKVTLLEFYSHIPLSRWIQKQDDISHIMNITIVGDIKYSKENLICFKSVSGRTPKESKALYDEI